MSTILNNKKVLEKIKDLANPINSNPVLNVSYLLQHPKEGLEYYLKIKRIKGKWEYELEENKKASKVVVYKGFWATERALEEWFKKKGFIPK